MHQMYHYQAAVHSPYQHHLSKTLSPTLKSGVGEYYTLADF